MNTFVPTKSLPSSLLKALSDLGYRKTDIGVRAATQVSPVNYGMAGCRAYVAIVDLATGETKVTYGSWGGANAYALSNPVDLDTKAYQIPPNVVVQMKNGRGGARRRGAGVWKTGKALGVFEEFTVAELVLPCSLGKPKKVGNCSGPYETTGLGRSGRG